MATLVLFGAYLDVTKLKAMSNRVEVTEMPS